MRKKTKLIRPCSICNGQVYVKAYKKQLIPDGELLMRPEKLYCGICLSKIKQRLLTV